MEYIWKTQWKGKLYFSHGSNHSCGVMVLVRAALDFDLRANVGIYRESQISSEKSNFALYPPNNPLVWLFQKMILKNPQALCIWIILEKFENSQKNTIFIHEISHNFERFQRNSTGAKDLPLTSSSSHI